MLDTNTASYIIKGTYPALKTHLLQVPMARICISVITEAELLFGLAKRPETQQLKVVVHEFLKRVAVLAWDSKVAECYARLRKSLEEEGRSLAAMDMLIAAHALTENAILVTQDQAFYKLKHFLRLVDWTQSTH